MKDTHFSLLLSILFLLVFCLTSQAAPKISEELIKSAVLLRSPNGRCASGFITDSGRVFTNAHVVSSLCPAGNCQALTLWRAEKVGDLARITVPFSSLEVEVLYRALDVAVLRITPPINGAFNANSQKRAAVSKIYALGFPNCKQLELNEGQIADSDDLRLLTTTSGAHGSSGSALFNENLELIGIVSQSATLFDAVSAIFLGTRFQNKGVPYPSIAAAISLTPEDAWDYNAGLLRGVLRDQSAKFSGMSRMRLSLDALNAIQGLAQDAVSAGLPLDEISPLLLRDSELAPSLPHSKETELSKRALLAKELSVLYALEVRGLRDRFFRDMDTNAFALEFTSQLNSPVQSDAVSALVTSFSKQRYGGIYVEGLAIALPVLIVAVIVFFLWSMTLGYTFSASSGGIINRCLNVLFVAVALWPLSFLAFLYKRRRRSESRLR